MLKSVARDQTNRNKSNVLLIRSLIPTAFMSGYLFLPCLSARCGNARGAFVKCFPPFPWGGLSRDIRISRRNNYFLNASLAP